MFSKINQVKYFCLILFIYFSNLNVSCAADFLHSKQQVNILSTIYKPVRIDKSASSIIVFSKSDLDIKLIRKLYEKPIDLIDGNTYLHSRFEFQYYKPVDSKIHDLNYANIKLHVVNIMSKKLFTHLSIKLENFKNSTSIEPDQIFISLTNGTNRISFISLGRMYLPFGNYNTSSLSRTILSELTESKKHLIKIGFIVINRENLSFYISEQFQMGIDVHYHKKLSDISTKLNISYSSKLAFKDRFQKLDFLKDGFINSSNFIATLFATYKRIGINIQYLYILNRKNLKDSLASSRIECFYKFIENDDGPKLSYSYERNMFIIDLLPKIRHALTLSFRYFPNSYQQLEIKNEKINYLLPKFNELNAFTVALKLGAYV